MSYEECCVEDRTGGYIVVWGESCKGIVHALMRKQAGATGQQHQPEFVLFTGPRSATWLDRTSAMRLINRD